MGRYRNNEDDAVVAFFVGAVIAAAVFLILNSSPVIYSSLEECEKELPRSQHCEAVFVEVDQHSD